MSLLLVTVTLTEWDLEHGGPLLPHLKDGDPEAQRQTMIHLCLEGGRVIVF